MRVPLSRQGEGPAAAYERHRQQREHDRQQLERFSRELHPEHNTPTRGTPAGDERKLRGIPAIARGVPGAIPGTTPHQTRR